MSNSSHGKKPRHELLPGRQDRDRRLELLLRDQIAELAQTREKIAQVYNAEVSHPSGPLIGVNLQTDAPIHVDFFDPSILEGGSTFVLGRVGEGHSFRVQAPSGETT